jgi:hypothetical protein
MNTILRILNGRWTGAISAATWILTYFFARALIENNQLSQGIRLVAALVPIIPFAIFLMSILVGIRDLDELHRRVHLEALAIAFPLTMLLLMLLGLVELVIPLSPDDWSYRHVWQFLPVFYFFGLALTWRRYQ